MGCFSIELRERGEWFLSHYKAKLLVHKKESQINMRNRVFFFKLFRFESPGRTLNFAVV